MNFKLLRPRNLILSALALITLGIASYPAWASLTVTPLLVVIEGRNRYADVNLINASEKTVSYSLEWQFMKMAEETGLYEDLDSSITDFDLTKNIVVTPRRVTIEPNGMQKIRLGLRLKGEPPPPGDYRAHLLIAEVGKPAAIEDKPGLAKDQAAIGVKVNVGFSIPVVYRVGESNATASIGDVRTRINENNKHLEALVTLNREGDRYGLLGHLIVYYNDKVIGEVKNANVFDEINSRVFTIPLTSDQLSGGTLRIVYKHYDNKNNTIFAEKTVPVGG